MGKTIENGSINEKTGMLNTYKVQTVENVDGEVYLNAQMQTGFYHSIRTSKEVDGKTEYTNIKYDSSGKIFNEDGTDSGINAVMLDNGSFQIIDGKYVFNDNEGKQITDEDILNKYEVSGMLPVYSDNLYAIPVTTISKVH
jgi:hypothetical protein